VKRRVSRLFLMVIGSMLLLLLSIGMTCGAQPQKLEIWTHTAFSPESTMYGLSPVFKELYKEFEEENNVKIEYEVAGGVQEIRQKTFSAAKVGNHPDIAVVNATWIPALARLGWIYPIDKFVTEEYLADYIEGSLEQCKSEGRLYGLEWYMAARAFFWRNDKLDEVGAAPPETWEELYTVGQKLTKPGQWAIGYCASYGDYTPIQLTPHVWGFGARIVDSEGKPVLDEPKNHEALRRTYQHWSDMVNKYKIAPIDVTSYTDHEITSAFIANQIVSMFNSSSRIRAVIEARPDLEEVMGGSAVPMPKGYRGAVDAGSWAWIITTPDPEKQELAWKFIEKAQSTKWLARIVGEHWGVPTRRSANPLILEKVRPIRVWKGLFKAFDLGSHPRPVTSAHRTLFDNLSLGAQEVVLQKITPEEAVNRVQEETMKAWKQAQAQD